MKLKTKEESNTHLCATCGNAVIRTETVVQCSHCGLMMRKLRQIWPKVHSAIRSDIMLAEAAEEISEMAEILKQSKTHLPTYRVI